MIVTSIELLAMELMFYSDKQNYLPAIMPNSLAVSPVWLKLNSIVNEPYIMRLTLNSFLHQNPLAPSVVTCSAVLLPQRSENRSPTTIWQDHINQLSFKGSNGNSLNSDTASY